MRTPALGNGPAVPRQRRAGTALAAVAAWVLLLGACAGLPGGEKRSGEAGRSAQLETTPDTSQSDEAATTRAWAAEAQLRASYEWRATQPPPLGPEALTQRQDAVAVGAALHEQRAAEGCPAISWGVDQMPGKDQVALYADASGQGPSALVAAGAWKEADCPIVAEATKRWGSIGTVRAGPGTAMLATGTQSSSTFAGSELHQLGSEGGAQNSLNADLGTIESVDIADSASTLLMTGSCDDCNFTDVPPFSGVTLNNVDFLNTGWARASYSNVTFTGKTNFVNARLSGTSFTDVTFQGPVDFSLAKLKGVTFTNVTFQDQAFIRKNVFDDVKFKNVTFAGRTALECPVFKNMPVIGDGDVSFTAPYIGSPEPCAQTFQGTAVVGFGLVPFESWSGLNMTRATIQVTDVSACFANDRVIHGANLSDIMFIGDPPYFQNVTFRDTKLDGANFKGGNLEGAKFIGTTTATATNFSQTTMNGADFTGASVRGASFKKASLAGASFANADLGDKSIPASFDQAYLVGVKFNSAKAAKASFQGAYIFDGAAPSSRQTCNGPPPQLEKSLVLQSDHLIDALSIDAAGSLYTQDKNANMLYRYDNLGYPHGEQQAPWMAMAASHSSRSLWATESPKNVMFFGPEYPTMPTPAPTQFDQDKFFEPKAIAADNSPSSYAEPQGTAYVATNGNNVSALFRVTATKSGMKVDQYTTTGLAELKGVTVDGIGNVYFVSNDNSYLSVWKVPVDKLVQPPTLVVDGSRDSGGPGTPIALGNYIFHTADLKGQIWLGLDSWDPAIPTITTKSIKGFALNGTALGELNILAPTEDVTDGAMDMNGNLYLAGRDYSNNKSFIYRVARLPVAMAPLASQSSPPSFVETLLTGANFSGALMGSQQGTFVSFAGANLKDASFLGTECINCDFSGSGATTTVLNGASFAQLTTGGAPLSSVLFGSKFAGASMTDADFSEAFVMTASLTAWTFPVAPLAPGESIQFSPREDMKSFLDVAKCPDGRQPSGAPNGCSGAKAVPNAVLTDSVPTCVPVYTYMCRYLVKTVAGGAKGSTAGFADGGPSRNATGCALFNGPVGVATNASGNTAYVADTGNSTVWKVYLNTNPPTLDPFAGPKRPGQGCGVLPGEEPTVDVALKSPTGVAMSPDGTKIAVADEEANQVIEIPTGSAGAVLTIGSGTTCNDPTSTCGDGTALESVMFTKPQGVWYDPNGRLYVADTGNNKIRVIATPGEGRGVSTFAGTGTPGWSGDGKNAKDALLQSPVAVSSDTRGNVFLVDAAVSPKSPTLGITTGSIRKIGPNGKIITYNTDPTGKSLTDLKNPAGVGVLPTQFLVYAANSGNGLFRISSLGQIRPLAGQNCTEGQYKSWACTAGTYAKGQPASDALTTGLSGPSRLAVTATGSVLFTDTNNNILRVMIPG